MMISTPYYSRHSDKIICEICPIQCKLSEGQVGLCLGREVIDGELITTNYGQLVALHLDPIEKKPLYHFKPGSEILSTGPNGCNLRCKWCQNCDISQLKANTHYYDPEHLIDQIESPNTIGIAYTYTEPLMWYEYLRDVMPLVHKIGKVNVLVSNGYISPKPLEDLVPYIDAANIDLKFIDENLYRKYAGCELGVIKKNIERMVEAGIHVELTHLLVSGLADNPVHTSRLAKWIASLDTSIPLHLSRYFPSHKWNNPATSISTLEACYQAAREHLTHVYMGNIQMQDGKDTHCSSCGEILIERSSYHTTLHQLDESGNCKKCGATSTIIM
ncbi:AmmeMemoRadiSam system radical SAM enzyme [bacterium]|nr:AmmeMemoRadiSam system radical SAM enzyme [bacterium]